MKVVRPRHLWWQTTYSHRLARNIGRASEPWYYDAPGGRPRNPGRQLAKMVNCTLRSGTREKGLDAN